MLKEKLENKPVATVCYENYDNPEILSKHNVQL